MNEVRTAKNVGRRVGIGWRIGAFALGAAVVSASTGYVHAVAKPRGAPRDWSHRHLVASRFGPDLEKGISADWRTFNKQARIDQAIQARSERQPLLELLNLLFQRAQPASPAQSTGAHLDWSLQTGGYGSVVGDPAKYSFDITTASCSDVIYYTVNQAGAAATVNVIAITNAYSFCPGNGGGVTPTVKFGIRMPYGTATSAVPSLDGTVLYVLESRPSANGGAILHAINVNNITTNPGTYNFGTKVWSNAHVLAAPTGLASSEQLFQVTFATTTDNVSSPYLDYATNQIYFGDSGGKVHRVLNALSTTASEDVAKFPVACGTQQLQSPVFASGQVIATSADGFLYRIDTTVGGAFTCIAAQQGGAGTSQGASGGLSAPVVDITNNKVIVVTGYANGFGVKGIGTFNLMFTAGQATTSGISLGPSDGVAPLTPAMDDAFWTTNNGNIYASGTPSAGGDTYLIRLPYNGAVGNPAGYAALHRSGAAASVASSPVTEFLTGSALANPDFLFVGGAGGNYLFMNRIASGFNGGDGTPVAVASSFAVPGGVSSGIIIDTNTAAVTGSTATANVYFGTVGVPATIQSTIVQLAQQF